MKRQILALWVLMTLCGCARSAQPPSSSSGSVVPRASLADATGASAPDVGSDTSALPEMSVYQLGSPWTDQMGATFLLRALRGRPQVVALVYASCKGACPRLAADVKAIAARLDARERERVGFVFVTIDPDVDTPARMRQFSAEQHLSPDWRLLRGSKEQVRELAATLDFKYRKISPDQYAHSNVITVLGSDGVVVHQQTGLSTDPGETVAVLRRQMR